MPAAVRERRAAYRLTLPGPLYCDSSALLKLYVPEPGSDEFNRTVEGRDDVLASDLAVTEIVSALARRVREGAVRVDVARRVQLAILESLDDGVYGRLEISRGVHRRAEHFLATLTGVPLRAADALHLALATLAQAASLASFDVRLRTAGRSVGLVTYPD